jgi:TonB family protein
VKPPKDQPKQLQKYTPPPSPNQVTARTPQAVANPMFGGPSGGGQVGISQNSVLGNRLGWYAQLIRDRLAQNWQTNGLDAHSQTSPAVVSFHILRDGSIRDPKIVQSSGNLNIDNTALRAVYASNPLTALPPQISENDILAEFTFNLR